MTLLVLSGALLLTVLALATCWHGTRRERRVGDALRAASQVPSLTWESLDLTAEQLQARYGDRVDPHFLEPGRLYRIELRASGPFVYYPLDAGLSDEPPDDTACSLEEWNRKVDRLLDDLRQRD